MTGNRLMISALLGIRTGEGMMVKNKMKDLFFLPGIEMICSVSCLWWWLPEFIPMSKFIEWNAGKVNVTLYTFGEWKTYGRLHRYIKQAEKLCSTQFPLLLIRGTERFRQWLFRFSTSRLLVPESCQSSPETRVPRCRSGTDSWGRGQAIRKLMTWPDAAA